MYIYPKNLPELLDFQYVTQRLESYCYGITAKQQALDLKPIRGNRHIMAALDIANEYFLAYMRGDDISARPYPDVQNELNLIQVENASLSSQQFFHVRKLCETAIRLLEYFSDKKEVYPVLQQLLSDIRIEKQPLIYMNDVLTKEGVVRDDASLLLKSIRRDLGVNRQVSDRAYRSHIQRLKQNNQLADIEESYINGRRVLAVWAEFKREIRGITLSQSATGKIVFIEPQNVIELNNEKLRLEEEEKKEVYRILQELTELVRPYYKTLKEYFRLLVDFDFLEAKAKLSRDLKATRPMITEKVRQTHWVNAFHPVLLLNATGKEGIVPMHVKFDDTHRIMVISGPNAGGKSIALKTIGLLQLMLQCGLMIPVSAKSECCLQQQLFGDIGDSQSIEDGLSTYSSRLQKMNHFLKNMNRQTMFLIDEFGTGSDPDMGGAMAEVILNTLNKTEAFGVVTTHFTNLKLLANHQPGIFNACMLFNIKTLKPLYQLQVGEPGSSFTFEVAEKIGLPTDIIYEAKQKLSKEKLKMDQLLAQLQVEKNVILKLKKDLQKQMGKTTAEKREFMELNEQLETTLEKTLEDHEEKKKLMDYGKKLHVLTKEWVENKNKKEVIQKFVKLAGYEQAKQREQEEYEKTQAYKEERIKAISGKIGKGSRVKVYRGREVGVIQEIKENRAKILFGRVLLDIGLERLELAHATEDTGEKSKASTRKS